TEKDENGKRIVRMPMKKSDKPLGTNLPNAKRQFHAQENRRMKDEVYNELYVDYMDDFIDTEHVSHVLEPEDDAHYLPHHGVLKESSTTHKLRTVFNAASVTETGISLNDVLCVGPTIQPESIDIITRFREKKYVITGDISKMYRQIWIHPSQRKYLSLLWRRTPDEPLKHYQLNVVTFGTSCAPFLATRVLKSIADEFSVKFPKASEILTNSFYVDDAMFGIDSIEEGIKIRDQLRYMLASSGMNLCKLTANHPALLEGVPAKSVEVSETSSIVKALGILFDVKTDQFSYQMKQPKEGSLTKADVLSEIAQIYDPIGWLGPVVLFAKIFMKKLWLNKLDWKDKLPEDLLDEWNNFRSNLSSINDIRIPRHCLIENHVKIELHGFCDASINGYGAVIYALSYDAEDNVKVSIICSKSRVAPNSQKTLAQLELCSATLLAKLIHRYVDILTFEADEIVLWSDSTIVLNWITMLSSKLKTFVGNRVAVIQELTHKYTWRHVKGEMNPADVISRGLLPQDLPACSLWWKGPNFLELPKHQWPQSIVVVNEADPEVACEV
ncbi:MAG: hypothetical protein JXL85_04745, partial [Bacilli bacterium]|nr:hypothetical protein [Bacilli bacterium]